MRRLLSAPRLAILPYQMEKSKMTNKQKIYSWEMDTISAIAKRAVALAYSVGSDLDEKTVKMDVTACVAGGCKNKSSTPL